MGFKEQIQFPLKAITVFTFVFALLFGGSVFAQETSAPRKKITNKTKSSKTKPKPKDAGQDAKIRIDGAALYEAPNFDSPVLEYMDQNAKVKISKKIYPGIGGLGAFYKIRVKKGVFAYIADTDVEISGRSRPSDTSSAAVKPTGEDSVDPSEIQPEMMGEDPETLTGETLYLTRYLGLAYNTYNYVEVISNQSQTAATPMFGLKLTGPTGAMGGMPLDMSVVFTSTAPNFYGDIASSTSGFMIIADALVTMPLYEGKSAFVYYGFGPVLRYSSWKVKLENQPNAPPVDSQEVGLGAVLAGGAAMKLGQKLLIRVEGKYDYEKEKYFGFGAALQFKY